MSYQILPQRKFVVEAAQTFKQNYPKVAERANGRIEKAMDLAQSGYVTRMGPDKMFVRSQEQPRDGYIVERGVFGGWASCSCADYVKGASNHCKHILASEFAERADALQTIEALAEWEAEMGETFRTKASLTANEEAAEYERAEA
jgi:predicted nucleic acid-binding Zn finger protein